MRGNDIGDVIFDDVCRLSFNSYLALHTSSLVAANNLRVQDMRLDFLRREKQLQVLLCISVGAQLPSLDSDRYNFLKPSYP